MNRFFTGVFAFALLAGIGAAQQSTSTDQTGKRNPNQQQNSRKQSHVSPNQTSTQPANPGDVPHQGAGSQSPDLKQHSTQNAPLPPASKRKHRTRHRRSTRTGTQR